MSLFSQLAGANDIIEWSNANSLKLRTALRKEFLKDSQLDVADADKFLSALEDKIGLTKWGPSNGLNEKEIRQELKELRLSQKDKFNPDLVDRIERILFSG